MIRVHVQNEFRRMLRNTAFVVSCVAVPPLLFASVGLIRIAGGSGVALVLASFCSYTVINTSMYSFGAIVAHERAQRMTLLMRSTALHPLAYFGSKLIAANIVVGMAIFLLAGYAALVSHVHLSGVEWAGLIGFAFIGTMPFVALGLALGYNCPPHATSAITNVVVLPISLASGVFIPISYMSPWVQHCAWFTPSYHFTQLLWSAVGIPSEPPWISLVWLTCFTVPLFIWAAHGYRKEERQNYG